MALKESEPHHQPRHQSTASAEAFYKELKESVSIDNETDAVAYTFASYKPAEKNNSDRLKNILDSIKQNSRKRLELYAVLGIECMNIKCTYIENKCAQHMTSTDLSKFINCLSCNKRNGISSFYTYVKNVTGYSRDYVSFFIRLADLCKCYPKLLYARVSTDSMHKYYSFIVRRIEDDRDFWSTAC